MSKYTTEERFICEEKAGRTESVGFNEIDEVLDECWDKIFTTDAPIFDEEYRKPLCKKILKHYWNREIGAETAGLWQLWMNRTLEEQLPYFNQLYKSALLKYPIFSNTDYATKHERENTGETTMDTTQNDTATGTRDLTGDKSVITDGTSHDETDGTKAVQTWGTSDTTTTEERDTTGSETIGVKTTEEQNTTGSETDDGRTTGSKTTTGSESVDTTKRGSKTSDTGETGSSSNTETDTHNDTTTTESSKTSENNHWDKYSDTPEGALDNITNDNKYLTDIRNVTDDGSEHFNETTQNNGGYTRNGSGSTKNDTAYSDNWTETDGTSESRTENVTESGTSHMDKDTTGHMTDSGTSDTNESRTEHMSDVGTSNTETKGTEDTQYHETNDGVTWQDEETKYSEHEDTGSVKDTIYNALGSSHDLEDFVEHVGGKMGTETYAEMLLHFRDTFLNIDMDLIQKFDENFMQLW